MHGEGKAVRRPACANNAQRKQDSGEKQSSPVQEKNPPKSIVTLLQKELCRQQTENQLLQLALNNCNSFPFKTKRHKIFMYVSTTLFYVVLIEVLLTGSQYVTV